MTAFISTFLIVAGFVLASGVIATMLAHQGRRIAAVLAGGGRTAAAPVAAPARLRARLQPKVVVRPRQQPLRAAA
nr:hypothetical protein [Sphingomonas sp. SCN 67-18]